MLDVAYRINAPTCISEAVEDDLILINLTTGLYYNMRHESAKAWQALEQGAKPSDLITANTWNETQCAQFQQYLQYLLDEQLLVICPDSGNQVEVPRIDLSDTQDPFQVDVFTDMQEMLLLDPIHDASADLGWPHKA